MQIVKDLRIKVVISLHMRHKAGIHNPSCFYYLYI